MEKQPTIGASGDGVDQEKRPEQQARAGVLVALQGATTQFSNSEAERL